ncbi:integrator complex subunit 6-A-like [Apostichopus japonicus]|uniref:integrator complex subunit 6-A-like n=1 Tax=Stichopus japonicus TaxID=307972 RepID=UPI003AB89D10
MPVLVFLLDTSASMNQRTYLGTSALDLAKGAVETFLKLRAREPASRGDRYMLVSCDDPPATVKAGWKENHATFMNELKNLQPTGLTSLGSALKQTFDLLNVNRLHSGIDNYGQGRNPFFLEPALVIALTDGDKLVNATGVQEELSLPMAHMFPGSELTKEPFRWDQRLFALVLRMGGVPSLEIDKDKPNARSLVNVDESPINAMCEVTGGRSYTVNSLKTLNQCLESLAQKVQSGVVVNFEKYGSDPTPTENSKISGRKSPIAMETETTTNGFLHGSNVLNGTKKTDSDNDKLSIPNNLRMNTASPVPPAQDTSWHSCRRLIYVRPNSKTGLPVGHWPVPESFWPDINAPTLPPRDSQPILRFTCSDNEPLVLDNLPFDKYELEPSPLTQYILERRNPNVGWQVYVGSSGKTGNDLGHAFGYLKASSNLSCVNLVIMPYNYPVLLPLLDDLFKVHKLKPSIKWRQAFDNYLRDVPNYYAGPLRVALRRMGAPNLIPDGMENCLSYSVVTYLKKLKQQSKVEAERMAATISKRPKAVELGIRVQPRSQMPSLAARKDFQHLLQAITGETVTVRADNSVTEFPGFMLRLSEKDIKPQMFRNAFDIPRAELLDQVQRMRTNFLQLPSSKSGRLMNEDNIHSIRIAEMGNYQEFLKTIPSPLREVEEGPSRLHTFGNPFKLASEKDKRMMVVDEADVNEAMTGPAKRRSESPKRRNSSSSPPSRQPTSPGAQDSILRKPVAELRKSSLIKQKGQQTAPPEPKPPEEVDDSLDDAVLVVDESGGEDAMTVDKADSLTSSNHVDSESSKEKKGNKKQSILDSGSGIKGQRHEPLAYERGINGHNSELKRAIVKEVRRPGNDFTRLFAGLENIKGDLDTKYLFVNAIIYEASRFKRRVLIKKLELFQRHMIAQEENNSSSSSGGSSSKQTNLKRARNHSVDQNNQNSHKAKKAKPR